MKQFLPKFLLPFLVLPMVAFFLLGGCAVTELKKTTIDTLNNQLVNSDIIIIDVRHGLSWEKSDLKIKGAVRENPLNVTSWADKYQKDSNIVLYCA
jgi:hypothetical protein